MSLPYARTFDEIYLYMDLRPCVCGETEFDDRTSSSVTVDGVLAERFTGHCANCGRFRQFTFQMPDEMPEISFEVRYGKGDEPSRLLDPGEWLGVSELYGMAAQDQERELDPDQDDQVTRAYYLLTSSLAAIDEVAKFIPADADAVPEGAFWSQAGRLVYETAPDRFTRTQLAEERAGLQQKVTDFEEKYGSEEEAGDADGAGDPD